MTLIHVPGNGVSGVGFTPWRHRPCVLFPWPDDRQGFRRFARGKELRVIRVILPFSQTNGERPVKQALKQCGKRLMSGSSFVEAFYERHRALYQHLLDTKEVSFASDLNSTFCRSLVLAIASYFEHEVIEILREVPLRHAGGNSLITSMIEKQVISRKYHTYFDWDRLTAGAFFGLFGEDFKVKIQNNLKADTVVNNSMKVFLELGQIRNRLVHQNYVQFDISKTPEELIKKFREALPFLEFLRQNLFQTPASAPVSGI